MSEREEHHLKAILKEMARGVIPGAVTWILAAITGAIASLSSHAQTGALPLTTIAYFATAGAGGGICFLLAGMYIWEPVHRFTSVPAPIEGRKPRESLVNELDLVEKQTRERIRGVTHELDAGRLEEEDWFKRAEVLFSVISLSRGLRKGYPTMVKAAKRATWAIALVGIAVLVSGIFVSLLSQDPVTAAVVALLTIVVVIVGVSVGFYNAEMVPVRSRWGGDVSTLCDSTSYEEMKEVVETWAEDAVRSRKTVPG